MRNLLIIAIASSFVLSNAFAQSFMTNSLDRAELKIRSIDWLKFTMQEVSRAYDVRICTEAWGNYKTPKWPRDEFVFTNTTFEHVFGTIMQATTNLTWRYENTSNTIYIHPTTNAIMMMRCGPISATNTPAYAVILDNEMLGFSIKGVVASETKMDFGYLSEEVSLEFEDAYIWEILDAMDSQMSEGKSWDIWEDFQYAFGFYTEIQHFFKTNSFDNVTP